MRMSSPYQNVRNFETGTGRVQSCLHVPQELVTCKPRVFLILLLGSWGRKWVLRACELRALASKDSGPETHHDGSEMNHRNTLSFFSSLRNSPSQRKNCPGKVLPIQLTHLHLACEYHTPAQAQSALKKSAPRSPKHYPTTLINPALNPHAILRNILYNDLGMLQEEF